MLSQIIEPFEKLVAECDTKLEAMQVEFDKQTAEVRKQRAFAIQIINLYNKYYGDKATTKKSKKIKAVNTLLHHDPAYTGVSQTPLT